MTTEHTTNEEILNSDQTPTGVEETSGYLSTGLEDLSPHEIGRRGELAAQRFLERKGFEILETNWTCFAGEADIIALDDSTICFIEVKTRTGIEKGFPAEAVNAKKRARYEKIAACYLREFNRVDMAVRFDIISILVINKSRAFLRMHTNAFMFDHGE